MLVTFQALVISEYFDYDRWWSVLTSERLSQPTATSRLSESLAR